MTTTLTFRNGQEDDFDCSLYEYYQRGVRDYPDVGAIQFLGKTWSHAFLRRAIEDMAAVLCQHGVRPGDAVTLCMPNVPAAIAAFYAINYVGGIISVLHPLTPANGIADSMKKVHSRVLIGFDKLYAKQADVLAQQEIDIILLGADEYFYAPMSWGIRLVNRAGRAQLCRLIAQSCPANVSLYRYGRKTPPDAPHKGRGEDVCLYLHSGGTTGTPKIIVVTNTMLNAAARSVMGLTQTPDVGRAKMLMVLPIFHGFGVGVCMHGMLPYGIRVVLVPAFNPDRIVRMLKQYRITYIVGVPTMFEKMLATGKLCGKRLRHLQNAYCGGDMLNVQIKAAFDDAMRKAGSVCRLYQGYGLSETVSVCCANSPMAQDCAGSIGLPVVGTRMSIRDEEGNALPDGQKGEICVAGNLVMQGYYDGTPEGVLCAQDGETWLHTGDYGYRDANGYYHFVGRKKRMSIVAGVNVYHQEIEQLAMEVAGVHKAAVTEVVANGKVSVKLWLLPTEDAPADLDKKVLAHLRRFLTKYCVPRSVCLVESMPETPLGKVDYRKLQSM